MKNLIDAFWTTWTTVTRLPAPARFTPRTRETGFFLPLIGIAAGAAAFGAAALVGPVDPFLAVFAVLIVLYGLFNLFHFDGLLDTADAFLCFASRERRLEILKDPRIGVFAFFTGALYLALKGYLLYRLITLFGHAAFPAPPFAVLIFSYPVTGRAAAALVPCLTGPARKDGLGAALGDYSRTAAGAGIVLAVLLPAVLAPAAAAFLRAAREFPAAALPGAAALTGAAAALIGIAAAGGGLALLYRRRAGGFTGDALGAAVELGEVLHLLTVYIGFGMMGTL
jgi:adenosylcobinamide-GDP ribazoletransferase